MHMVEKFLNELKDTYSKVKEELEKIVITNQEVKEDKKRLIN